jgi:hypothetical protein
MGKYADGTDMNGLAFYRGSIITVSGVGAGAVIRELSTTAPPTVVQTHSVLLAADLPIMDSSTTILYADDIKKWFIVGGSTAGRIIRLSEALGREARGVNATVVEGTDGHLYSCQQHPSPGWLESNRPISGANWNIFWDLITDDICDSPITIYGDGADPQLPYSTYAFSPTVTYNNGYLYIVLNQSVNRMAIRKINATTLGMEAAVDQLAAGKPLFYGNRIYVLVGTTGATVYAFSASDLSQVAISDLLPYGRFVGGVGEGDLAVVNGQLIVTTIPFTSNSALYALNLTTLAIEDVKAYNDGAGGPNYTCLARIDDNTVVLAENAGVGIAYLSPIRVPSGKTQLLEGASPPYLSFGKYLYSGVAQQWVIAKSASSGESLVLGSSTTSSIERCGTSPVWPMPA